MKVTPTDALRAKLDIVHALCTALDVSVHDLYCYTVALDAAEVGKEMQEADPDRAPDEDGYRSVSLLSCSNEDSDELMGEGQSVFERAIEFAEAYKL